MVGGGLEGGGCVPGPGRGWRMGDVYLVLGGGVGGWGVYLAPGVVPGGVPANPVNRMTDRCKILPCPKLRLWAVTIQETELDQD